MNRNVRMLWSRSASLTTTMRQSSAMAMNMDRMFSTCSFSASAAGSSRAIFGSFDTLVSPSTMRRTSTPNMASTSPKVRSVSSTVSWSRPETTVSRSMCVRARIFATSTGWVTKGSPDRLFWPRWARNATSTA